MESLKKLKFEISSRSHTCGELRQEDIDKDVVLCGWVQKTRDLGSLIFVDLRDRYGVTQLVFDSQTHPVCFLTAKKLRMEFVIKVNGRVRARPEDAQNIDKSTGSIEVLVESIDILNESKVLPFMIEDDVKASEELRFQNRFLDLRRNCLQHNLLIRDKAMIATREFLHENNFVDIETPQLFKSTPEGARDYLVPSRIHKGKFYALPQSPQLLKQILVIAGFDRYFQIVKCFRDEDQRANRQPEFTQIDIEMSFVDQDDVFKMTEGLFENIFFKTIGVEIRRPFPIISYDEAYSKYGTDKPDLRFDLELHDISEIFSSIELNFIRDVIDSGGSVVGFKLTEDCKLSRKGIDNLTEEFKTIGGKGLIWIKYIDGNIKSSISKFLNDNLNSQIIEKFSLNEGETILIASDAKDKIFETMGGLRLKVANMFNLMDKSDEKYKFLWVDRFPLFDIDNETDNLVAKHNPTAAPLDEFIGNLTEDPLKIRAKQYDLVINGEEAAGGSIRINKRSLQERVFNLLGMDEKNMQEQFGFLLNALEYGAPPHGGIAVGFDRVIMSLCGTNSIQDVIAFPKTTRATCLMSNAPSVVSEKQLNELHIKLKSIPND